MASVYTYPSNLVIYARSRLKEVNLSSGTMTIKIFVCNPVCVCVCTDNPTHLEILQDAGGKGEVEGRPEPPAARLLLLSLPLLLQTVKFSLFLGLLYTFFLFSIKLLEEGIPQDSKTSILVSSPSPHKKEKGGGVRTHWSGLCWSCYDVELVNLYHPRLALNVPHRDL